MPRKVFYSNTLAIIRDFRKRGQYPTCEQVAKRLFMHVSTFDRYRAYYDVFRDWGATVRAVDLTGPAVPSEQPSDVSYWMEVEQGDDGELRVSDVDPTYADLLGRTVEEMIGMTSPEATGHASVPELKRAALDVMAAGAQPGRMLQWVQQPSGAQLWFACSLARIDARHFRIRLEPIVEMSAVQVPRQVEPGEPLLCLTIARSGVIVAANEAVREALGYSRAELIDANYEALLRPGQRSALTARPRLMVRVRRIRDTGDPIETVFETSWKAKNGDWLRLRAQVQWSPALEAWTLRCEVLERASEAPAIEDLPPEQRIVKMESRYGPDGDVEGVTLWLRPDPQEAEQPSALRKVVDDITSGPLGPALAAGFTLLQVCQHVHLLGPMRHLAAG